MNNFDDIQMTNIDGIEYKIDTKAGEALVVNVCKTITIANILSEVVGYKVIGIGEFAFRGCTLLKSIAIPDCVTFIENNAFMECTSLSEVTTSFG